ncbi:hypothetical protein [Marinomonas pollencensis]|uniref:Uncharacterized protein n=1 Tax=Marinomonas pollencensis TaxID=491954 RepID=A0A3E0DIY5_9GAMM|nr:hypothetical protein [Marinomonas pollencensis]REG82637.1 hypothetical protein DFP81_10871 [Marinomonas pollencensis]
MKTDYKYDNLGNLDTDYYVEKAYEMRRYYLSLAFKKAVSGVKKAVLSLIPTRSVQGRTAH